MSWLKKAGDWLKGAGKTVSDKAEDIVEDVGDAAKDFGEGAGKVAKGASATGKMLAEGVVNSVIKVGNAAGDLVNAPDIPEVDFTDKDDFLNEKKEWINNFTKSNKKLIEQGVTVARNLSKHKDELKRSRKENTPLSAKTMGSTGATELFNQAESEGSKSLSIGFEADGSIIVGVNGSAGVNYSLTGSRGQRKNFITAAGSAGPSIGLDAAIEIGFWKDEFDNIGGWTQGAVVGASFGGGVALSFWWKMSDGKFAGWTLSPQAGYSAELEYGIGNTWMT